MGQTGVRQEDPHAPFLFIMVAQGLDGLMREVVRQKLFEMEGGDFSIFVLQCVDDTLFLGIPSFGNILTLMVILRCFGNSVGVKS